MTDRQAEADNKADTEMAIHALHGILTALDWIDDNFLDERALPDQIKTARTELIAAGKLICEQAAERF